MFIPTPDETWHVQQEGFDPYQEHDMETLFTVGNGLIGVRGASDTPSRHSRPGMFVAGLFSPTPDIQMPQLVVCPHPFSMDLFIEGERHRTDDLDPIEHRRVLDLRQGLLLREWEVTDAQGRRTALRTIRGAALRNRHILFQYVEVRPLNYSGRLGIDFTIPGKSSNMGGVEHLTRDNSAALGRGGTIDHFLTRNGRRLTIASRATPRLDGLADLVHESSSGDGETGSRERYEWTAAMDQTYAFTRIVSVTTDRECNTPMTCAEIDLDEWSALPMEDILTEHENSWGELWRNSDVVLEGDSFIQQAIRFYLYHLLIAANPEDDGVSIGARTLSGEAYNGHVFWDTETFMLPFFVATQPKMARALMMYRFNTLDGARRKAQHHGYKGAFYAWESADTGDETTPEEIYLPDENRVIPIHTGYLQVHISADVAHAVRRYWHATHDAAFMRDAGVEILLETARFWVSRSTEGEDGFYHIEELQGPDEYHVYVSDNAYTNYMASWNVLRALEQLEWLENKYPDTARSLYERVAFTEAERERLQDFAVRIYFPDYPTGPAIEQFRGYFNMDQRTVQEFGRQDGPISAVLEPELLQKTQIIKQADTLLLFQLFPELACKIGFKRNFDYYEPRTDHGSSLSYPTHAQLAARLGYKDLAYEYLRLTAGLDLNDVMGNAPLGIHAATAGGLWQAIIFGFAGLRYEESGISIDPQLPESWKKLEFSCFHRGTMFHVRINNYPLSWEIETRESIEN